MSVYVIYIVVEKDVGLTFIVVGFAVFQMLLSVLLGKAYGSLQTKFMLAKDLRMRCLDETFNGIKTIKLNSLEEYF
jgi:ABC-type bacteriocin/lantibiotic exporter with double-glycine peptidase domain